MISEILGYKFKNPQLLKQALTHKSLSTSSNRIDNYERLEFLGDSVLNLLIVETLILKFTDETEGSLAKKKAFLVSGEVIAQISRKNGIANKILMSEAEEKCGGRNNDRTIGDILEAIIGAIYLDGGMDILRPIILNLWQSNIDKIFEVPIDPKSCLQEILQSRGIKLPNYELVELLGPNHLPTFKIKLSVPGFKEVIGEGKSKKQAEKNAAQLLLEEIND